MFEDERRPLYKLCRKIALDRISEMHYKKHLNKAAKMMWSAELEETAFRQIMLLTERHPYYVNYLCDELWSQKTAPTITQVDQAWQTVVEEERSDLLKDFFSLTENQRKMMIYLANHGGKNIYAADAAKKMDIPISSIARVLSSLIEKYYIEKSETGYQFIVPVFNQVLAK